MLAVIVAGCSSAPAGTGSSGSNSAAATHQKAVKFAECIRDDGVGDSDGAGTVSPMSDARIRDDLCVSAFQGRLPLVIAAVALPVC
jgi:hypothetical protein